MEQKEEIHGEKHDRFFLEIPSGVVESWGIEGEEPVRLIHNKNELKTIHGEKEKREIPKIPTLVAGVSSFILLFIAFFNYHQIPLTGHRSIAAGVTILGVFFGIGTFGYHLHLTNKKKAKNNQVHISLRHYPAILTSYGVMLVVGMLFLFRMLSQLFFNASFDVYTASTIGAIFIAIIVYVMTDVAQSVTPLSLIRSLIFIIIGGVSIAMITNKDQQWWLANFSFLGTPEATQSWKFNLTLMLSALLMIALIDYLFLELYEVYGKTKNIIILKVLLIATAICLGGVGFFPYNDSVFYQQMHNRVAGYLVYLFIILIICAKWIIPDVSKSFLQLSYFIGAILVVTVIFFIGIPYLSLTAFELIAFVLAFSWLLMLLQNLIDKIEHKGHTYEGSIKGVE